MPHGLKLSEIKANIRNVIENLEALEYASNAPLNEFNLEHSHQVQVETSVLLEKLAQVPFQKIVHIQQQRKQRRRRKKKSDEKQKQRREPINHARSTAVPVLSTAATKSFLPHQKQTQHITLKKRQDSTNMLQSLDLLEKLYKARGGKDDFSAKLAGMRRVWQRVQQESIDAINQTSKNCETQWAKVLFGSSSFPMNQRTAEPRYTRAFLKCRSIWDSYLSSGKLGSSIPHGWVLPTEDPMALWAIYKCE